MSDKIITLDNLNTFKTKIESEINDKQDKLPTVVNDRYLHTNSSTGALEWTSVSGGGTIPTVTIDVSQVISQNPLTAQLTNEQYDVFANNKQVVLDLSALGQPNVVWQLQIDESSYMCFGFVSADYGTTLDSNLIDINKSTKVVTYYNNTIGGGTQLYKHILSFGSGSTTNDIKIEIITNDNTSLVGSGNAGFNKWLIDNNYTSNTNYMGIPLITKIEVVSSKLTTTEYYGAFASILGIVLVGERTQFTAQSSESGITFTSGTKTSQTLPLGNCVGDDVIEL